MRSSKCLVEFLDFQKPVSFTSRKSSIAIFLFIYFFGSSNAFGELRGNHLRGCAITEVPYTYRNDNRRLGFAGTAITYLERLQDNLQFALDLKEWNGTWSSLVNHMATCDTKIGKINSCNCDIGVGPFSMTKERVAKVNFLWPFGYEEYHFVTRKTELEIEESENKWFLFKTFSKEVWLIITLIIFLHAIGTLTFGPYKSIDERNKSEENTRNSSWLSRVLFRFPTAILGSYSHMIGSPIMSDGGQRNPSFDKVAWLLLGISTGFFLLTIYQSSLTVLLSEIERESPLKRIEDITNCMVSPEKIALIKGTASQDFWNAVVNTTLNVNKCEWRKSGIEVRDLEEGFSLLVKRKADYFYDFEGSVLFRAHQNCDVYQPVGEPFFSTPIGFFLPKSMDNRKKIIHKILNEETIKLRERNEIPPAKNLAMRNECRPVTEATISKGRILGFFILYISFWSSLLVYRCIFLWRRNQTTTNFGNARSSMGDHKRPENF